MKKQSIAIIAVVAFVLAVAVGYALFSETITINGTATAQGNFDIEFVSAGTTAEEGFKENGYTLTEETDGSTKALAEISTDKNTLTINVNKLDFPGAYVEIPVTIKNSGSIDAVITGIVETGSDTTSPVKISYKEIIAKDATLKAGATEDFVVRVEWLDLAAENNAVNVTATFKLEIEAEQVKAQ